ncbi:hypothetical protein QFC24_006265 [Naganishia onofrii]|uniref:Uncharacterized protein n=1 Tax=Naganishia onofrii TaxID=1851511 RepID=A0ACC2X305_9TREE|nr:hypothetical protein QFC24_006265 [Naganishia onofrii]
MAGRRKNRKGKGAQTTVTAQPAPEDTDISDIDTIPSTRGPSPVPPWIYAPSYIIERDENEVPTEEELAEAALERLEITRWHNIQKRERAVELKKLKKKQMKQLSSTNVPVQTTAVPPLKPKVPVLSSAPTRVIQSNETLLDENPSSTDVSARSLAPPPVAAQDPATFEDECSSNNSHDNLDDLDNKKKKNNNRRKKKKRRGSTGTSSASDPTVTTTNVVAAVSVGPFSSFLVCVSMLLVGMLVTSTVPAGRPSATSFATGISVYDDGESCYVFDAVLVLPVATSAPESPSVSSKPVLTPEPALGTPKIFFGPDNRNMSTGNSSAYATYTVSHSPPAKPTTVRPTLYLAVASVEHQGGSESVNITTGQLENATSSHARPGFFQNLRAELEEQATPALVKLMSKPRELLEQWARLRPRYSVDNTLGETTLLPNRWRLEVGPLFGFDYGCYARSADLEEEDSVANLKAMSSETLLVRQIESANDKMLSDHIETLQKRTEDLTAKLVACETSSESRPRVKKRPCVRRPRQKQVKAQSLRYLYDRNRMHKQTCPAVYEPKPESSIETRPSLSCSTFQSVPLPISSPTKTFYNFAVPPAPSVSSFLFLNIRFSASQHAQLIATVSELSLLQVVYAMEHLLLLCFIAAFLSCKWPKRNRSPVSDDYHANTATDSPTANLSAPMMSSIDAASLSTTIEGNASVDDALPSTTIEGNLGVDFVERASSVEEPLTSDDSDTGESSVPMKTVEAVHDALPSTTIEDNAGVHDLSSITVEAIDGIDVAEQDPSVGEPLTSDADELMDFPETAGQLTHKKTRRAKRAGKKRVQDRRCARELREAEKNAQDLALTVAIESRLHVM